MKLKEFRELTKDLDGESELVLWCYFEILDDTFEVIKDASQGFTNFELDISPWTDGKHALHFTLKDEDAESVLKKSIN